MKENASHMLSKKIFSTQKISLIERSAILEKKGNDLSLMKKAARFSWNEIRKKYPNTKKWLILCGIGNNAGDGMALASIALKSNFDVKIYYFFPDKTFTGCAAEIHTELESSAPRNTLKIIDHLNESILNDSDLIIDAIFGIGINRPIENSKIAKINLINNQDAAIVSLDIPSGVHPNSGQIMGAAIKASMTITFISHKLCFYIGEGKDLSGDIKCSHLDISQRHFSRLTEDMRIINKSYTQKKLLRRKSDAHKGDYGHVLIVGGGPGMHGAALLSGESSLRGGAGKVTIFMHESHRSLINKARPELMFIFSNEEINIQSILSKVDVVAIGPGLGLDDWARSVFKHVNKSNKPLVVDADALNILSEKNLKRDDWVLTPHPGEAATLMGKSSLEIQENRLLYLKKLKDSYGGTIVLKGNNTLIGSKDMVTNICTQGNPGMASAGMGDVLTGLIAAMISQGMDHFEAASVGVEVHARAGDLAARGGERGLIAGDVINEIRGCVNL